MKLKILLLFFILSSIFAVTPETQASQLQEDSMSTIISAYRSYKDIDNISINAPTVVKIPFTNDFIERFDFAVFNRTTNSFEPFYFKKETLINEIPISITAHPIVNNLDKMIDRNTKTYADFILTENTQKQTQIILSSASPITSSVLTILLDKNTALPNFIEIRALVNGQNRIVIANRKISKQTIRFPKTTSNKWEITFTYGQPLRISELRLNQDNAKKSDNHAIKFLAQPKNQYRIYFDPDRAASAPVGEAGDLISAQDILALSATASRNNPNYIIADIDNDGVPDIRDNCVSDSNPEQIDINNNGRGDVCDDFDKDGIINSKDNCPNNPNRNQKDTDSDGIGDICDTEESRITERYPWIPWVGIGFAALVLITLFILTARTTHTTKKQ